MPKRKANTDPWAEDTLLGDWLKICIKWIGGFFLAVFLIILWSDRCHQPYGPSPKQGWKNWDPSIDPTLIESLNYNTGEVTYRKPGPGYKIPIEKETFQDQMTEYVLQNIDVEQLWDRISDEGYLVE